METLRVLVADDETGMRLAIARVLGTFHRAPAPTDATIGFEVQTAETGEEALEMIAEACPTSCCSTTRCRASAGWTSSSR